MRFDGTSALVVAAHSGHGELAAWLLETGADPNAAKAGYGPLHAAILRGDADLASALLARGADPDARLKNGSPHARYGKFFALEMRLTGATPYFLAAKYAEADIMRQLAAAGADTAQGLAGGMRVDRPDAPLRSLRHGDSVHRVPAARKPAADRR